MINTEKLKAFQNCVCLTFFIAQNSREVCNFKTVTNTHLKVMSLDLKQINIYKERKEFFRLMDLSSMKYLTPKEHCKNLS